MRKFLIVLLSLGIPALALAQSAKPNCPQTLRLATSTYDQGRLHEVEELLKGCLNEGFTDQEKEAAYKLLALTDLYLEEPEKADEAMLNLLKTNPYFETSSSSDPAEFIALYKTFRTRPIYRVGVNLGVNASAPNVVSYSPSVENSNANYNYKISFQFGATGDVPITDKITINAGVGYQLKSFELISTHVIDGKKNILTMQESQALISIPITGQYQLVTGRYNPYVAAGIAADFMLSSEASAERLREEQSSVEPKTFDLLPQRNRFNLNAVIAGGAKVRVGGGYMIGEARYSYGITKVNSIASTYLDYDVIMTYGVPDVVFKVSSLSVTLSYVQNIFKPKKKTRK
jgi:hypothetical protein